MRRKKHKHHRIPAPTSNGITLPLSMRTVYSQYRDFYQHQPTVEYLVRTLVNQHGWPVKKVAHYLTATTAAVNEMLNTVAGSSEEVGAISYKNIDSIANATELTPEKKIRRLYYRYGLGVNEIAKRLNSSEDFVRPRWNFEFISSKLAQGVAWQSEWTLKKEKQAIKFVEELGYKKAAKSLDCPVFEVIYLMAMLNKTRVKLPEYEKRRRIYTCHDRALVLKYHAKGYAYVLTAEKANVTHNFVVAVLKENGLYKNKQELAYDFCSPEKEREVVRLYVSAGYTMKEIGEVMGFSVPFIKGLLDANGVIGKRERSAMRKHISKKEDKRLWYYTECKRLTGIIYRRYKHLIDPLGLRCGDHHLDHIMSIYDGYCRYGRVMSFKAIAHPANLRVISKLENLKKNSMSVYDRRQLYAAIKEWEAEYGAVDWQSIKNST